jgi:CHAT domain
MSVTATYDCDDFRVSFGHGEGSAYVVTARAAYGRLVDSTFSLPMTLDRLEEAVLLLEGSQTRSRSSREISPEMVTVVRNDAEDLGSELAQALFDTTIGPFYDEARRGAALNGRGVRLTLSLASTPELLSVPWELLYRRPSFLASQRKSPVVRYLEIGETPPPARIEGPVQVLGVVASPPGLPELDVADERARVERALEGMTDRGLVTLDWCDPATPRSLRERLRDGSYHVLHYVGHSDFTPDGDGLLFLIDEAGGPAQVTEAVLTNLLGDQTSLRLAVLNSCEGARTTLTDPFAGIATSLVALGVPAVVAMQFTISDRAAIVFAEELFTSLIGRQYPVDAAVSEARKAVFTEVNEIEWATPVLFLRSADGRLFDFVAEPVVLPLPAPPTPILVEPGDGAPTQGSDGATDTDRAVADADRTPPRKPLRTSRRAPWVVLAGAVALAAALAAFLWVSGDDSNEEQRQQSTPASEPAATVEEGRLEITPSFEEGGSTIEISGDPCPPGPDDALNTGINFWLDSSAPPDPNDPTVFNRDITPIPDGTWAGRIHVPENSSPDADYTVGAACWATYGDGSSANFFEYSRVQFDVIES